MTEKPTTYGKVSQILHWVTALLIFVMLIVGFVMVNVLPEGEVDQFFNNHVMGGWVLLVLMVLRLIARWREPAPDAPEKLTGGRAKLFKWNHVLLYVFVILMLSSGLGILSLSGLSVFPGNITQDAIQKVPPIAAHDIFSKVVFVLVIMHIGGVLNYQFTKGDVLGRMGVHLKK